MAGHEYDPTYPYTVGDLMQLGLGSCGQMIDNVLSAAIAEEGVEQKLAAFHKLWIQKEFKLAKHLPESLLRGGNELFNLLKINVCFFVFLSVCLLHLPIHAAVC